LLYSDYINDEAIGGALRLPQRDVDCPEEPRFIEWRDMHVRFEESMIGARPGSGGGDARYLRATTSARAFPCLWDARAFVQRDL